MELAMELIRPWAQHRLTRPTLSCELVALIRSAFDLPSKPLQAAQAPEREVALLHNSHFNPEKRCRDCPGTAKKSNVANLLRRKWSTSLATRWILLITPPNSIGLEVHPAEIRDS
ncbi:hypothetical protein Pmani_017645 [Petrolisthes manimaculis]|uniref:Uncharacterized protein n=1 Tax=Petrolisthes manimaculis TaxID=1843537 RepID=A0AAE1U971_9EUCA|nr:hypothetical protein Pmani_017645 [Petrolisthes manimaculis]